ncbi:MAG: hypothetical protein MUP73_02115 [Dehalococcoidia bacterium]|nr:hypothetical protein [Dehalococcoidia bacterium]
MKRLAYIFFLFGILGTVAVFMGCGSMSGEPSEANCRTVIENRISEGNLEQLVEIVSFKKADSYTVSIQDKEVYVVYFELEVRYLDEVREVTLEGITSIDTDNTLTFPSGNKGELQIISDKMEFLKTDKGWRGQDDNIY